VRGGEAGQPDGRGGRGGRNGLEAAGFPNGQLPDGTWLSDYGRGGSGANTIEYNARLVTIEKLRAEYSATHPEQPREFWDRRESVPLEWLNAEL
jgi:hypothetical protein